MKKYRILSVLIILCLSLSAFGCSGKNNDSAVLFTIENYDVKTDEFINYLIQTLSCYQIENQEMSDEVKQEFIDENTKEIATQVVLEKIIKESGVELTKEEMDQIVNEKKNIFIQYYGDNVLKEYGISEQVAEQYFDRTALIAKYQSQQENKYAEEFKTQLKQELSPEQFCSFHILSFDTEENAVNLKNSFDGIESYEEILKTVSENELCENTEDKGIYGGFDSEINQAIEGLQDGCLSDIFLYNEKYTIILMKNSADEEFYEQTISYGAKESAKNQYAQDVSQIINDYDIDSITIPDELLELVDPEKIYKSLCTVESQNSQ